MIVKKLSLIFKKLYLNNKLCKICKLDRLKIRYHVAICENCGVLLYYPYPESDKSILQNKKYNKDNIASNDDIQEIQRKQLEYIKNSGNLNIAIFKNIINFSIPKQLANKKLDILDYGGGSGQFASIFKNLHPNSQVYLTDLYDEKLLDKYKQYNKQIKFLEFDENDIQFDYIFLNDVFEHLSDPDEVLQLLKNKLKGKDSRIFIDTPKKFWIYGFSSFFNQKIYKKILNGTVDQDHQQIWSKKSFYLITKNSGLLVDKYKQVTEFTQPASFYLNAMKIENIFLRILGRIFYFFSPLIARNKIISTLKIK